MNGLVKKYSDVTAVDGLSFNVAYGELFGLLGPNGAGKSTTVNILCGLVMPTAGTARVVGHEVTKQPLKVKERIGVCPQETVVFPSLTGRENIELFGKLHLMTKSQLKDNTQGLLDKLGLSDDAGRRAGRYSGGMKRRLNIAMALINDPELIFLDEPTVGMDVQSRHAVWDFLKELKTRNRTIILTTHYMEEAEQLCDRVGIIDYGKLVALGTAAELRSNFGAKDLEEVFVKITGRKIRSE